MDTPRVELQQSAPPPLGAADLTPDSTIPLRFKSVRRA
jgi:hypothetical protein